MPDARITKFFDDFIDSTTGLIAKHHITHAEYRQAVAFLAAVADAGELPLVMDLFLETAVDESDHAHHRGSPTAIEGPFYLPDAPLLTYPYVLPMRPDEPGDILFLSGTVRGTDGERLAGVTVDLWQADALGNYSGFSDVALPNLRGRFVTDDQGRFEVQTMVPASYEIPKTGPTGLLLAALGRHAFRPAHLHVKLTRDRFEPMTTQLYFEGDRWLDSDVANAVKPGLVVTLERHEDPIELRKRALSRPFLVAQYDFVLQAVKPAQRVLTG